MLLDLSQMRGARDRFERTYPPSAFGPSEEDYRIAQPVRLALDVHKNRTEFRLVGQLSTVLELECGRCVEPFTLPVDAAFDVLYLPHSKNVGEGEVEIEEDDLDTAFYRGEVIDLGQFMREQLYLVLPMKPLCQEACRGLCPHCGTNLNQSACTCASTWVDPRLEPLRSLGQEKNK
jgi:uncharacterized protein